MTYLRDDDDLVLTVGGREIRVPLSEAVTVAEALTEAAWVEGYSAFLDAIAPNCRCCDFCWECPCGGCQAGGMCDMHTCTCDDEPEGDFLGYDFDDDEDR